MKNYIQMYVIAVIVFFTIDIIWLAVVAKKMYQAYLGYLMSSKPNWVAAMIFYLLFIIGIVYFVVNPAVERDSWKYALSSGIIFGLITYATYDLTNLATIKDWPVKITVIDLLWGSILTGSVSLITYFIFDKLNHR